MISQLPLRDVTFYSLICLWHVIKLILQLCTLMYVNPFFMMISRELCTTQCQICGKRKWQTGILLLIWCHPFYGSILWNKNWTLGKLIPASVLLRYKKKKKNPKRIYAATFDDSSDEDLNKEQKGKIFFLYHGTRKQIMDECTTLKALIRQARRKKS